MRFLCLAYGEEKGWMSLSEEQRAELLAQDEAIRQRGALMAAVGSATTVTAWDGSPVIAAGPAAGTGVPLAGFSVIEAGDLDEVVALVSKTPCAVAGGAIEIRAFLEPTP